MRVVLLLGEQGAVKYEIPVVSELLDEVELIAAEQPHEMIFDIAVFRGRLQYMQDFGGFRLCHDGVIVRFRELPLKPVGVDESGMETFAFLQKKEDRTLKNSENTDYGHLVTLATRHGAVQKYLGI